jgi:manganese/zinc/iron transport system permease protein
MHDDAGYPSERGMLQVALGVKPPAATLASLESRGLIRSVTHPPETTPHWELTKAGHSEAAALSGEPETKQRTK